MSGRRPDTGSQYTNIIVPEANAGAALQASLAARIGPFVIARPVELRDPHTSRIIATIELH